MKTETKKTTYKKQHLQIPNNLFRFWTGPFGDLSGHTAPEGGPFLGLLGEVFFFPSGDVLFWPVLVAGEVLFP